MSRDSVYVTVVPSPGIVLRVCQFWRKSRVRMFMMRPDRSDLGYLSELYLEGKLRPIIDQIFTFDQLRQAFDKSMTGRTSGKVVVRV